MSRVLYVVVVATICICTSAARTQPPLSSSSPPPPVQMALQTVAASEGSSSALCLDGSPYKYYWRGGLGDDAKKFLLAFQGGGWCTGIALHQGYDINATTIKACASRALGKLGSSKNWAPVLGDWDPHGMTSTNCTANPAFCRWSVAYLPYCDGTSFSSARGPPVPVPTADSFSPVAKIFFRGRANLIAVLNDLLAHKGLTSATALVVSGHSAGGLATFLNADFVHSKLPASTSAGLKFFGAVPDGGFCAHQSTPRHACSFSTMTSCLHSAVLDAPNRAGSPQYGTAMRALFAIGNASGSLTAQCVASRVGVTNSSPYDCLFPQYHGRFVQTPIRATQSVYDAWQLPNILGLGCSPPSGQCSAAQLADFQHYRNLTLAGLHGAKLLTPRSGGGAWVDSCIAHVQGYDGFFGDNSKFRVPGSTGVTVAESLQQWVTSNANGTVLDASNYHVDQVPWPLNKPCSGI